MSRQVSEECILNNTSDHKRVGMEMSIDVRIPVAKDVSLSARIWRPLSNSSLPTIFVLTPYVQADENHQRAIIYVQQDFVFLVVDVRGRNASDGHFTPHQGHGVDGCAVIQWITPQPWSNGQVVMEGSSYEGMVQWQIAAKGAKQLSAIVPTAAPFMGIDCPALDNQIISPYMVRWLSIIEGRSSNFALFTDAAFWTSKYFDLYLNHHPFYQFDERVQLTSPYFKK